MIMKLTAYLTFDFFRKALIYFRQALTLLP